MKKKLFIFTIVFIISCASFPNLAFAKINFKWGPYERLRYEYWKNMFDLDNSAKDNRSFFRIKTSLWGEADFNEDINLFVKLTNENKAYTYYYQTSTGKKGYRYSINEVVFDNLYLGVKNLVGLPLDLRLGRQDLSPSDYGEGFILNDGTPEDGTRTYYFNALKATWHWNDKNTTDFLYIDDPKKERFLPVINHVKGKQMLNATDETGCGIYHKSDTIKNLHLESYYFFKTEEGGTQILTSEETKLNTIGSFGKYTSSPWVLRAQLAYQFGTYGDNDREGVGGYLFLDRDFKSALWSPIATIGFMYLSGNDRNSSKNEAWDPLFSRWGGAVSELYNSLYLNETGTIAYWTNLQLVRVRLVLSLTPKAKLSFWYNLLRANENPAPSTFFGSGKTRGHLPQAKIEYAFNKNISTYILAEYFIPGDFYADGADDALFLRSEIQLKF